MNKSTHSFDERDPERLLKLKECCDLLLAAGYFRARLPSLSAFDKVVGGLVWSITASGIDVDVDIIFQENSSIGQKIKLSDQIIKCLVQMKSPKLLQPQQIQGLDYDHLFPVIQWLIRHVIETRRLTGDNVRAQSIQQFHKQYIIPSESLSDSSEYYVKKLLFHQYRPNRQFRQKSESKFNGIHEKTEATLLEYGEKIFGSNNIIDEEKEEKIQNNKIMGGQKNSLIGKFDPSKSKEAADAKLLKELEEKKLFEQKELERLQQLQSQMYSTNNEDNNLLRLSGENVENLIGLQSVELHQAQLEYENEKKRMEELNNNGNGNGGILSKKNLENSFQRQLESMKKRLQLAQSAVQSKEELLNELQSKSNESLAELEKKRLYIARIENEMNKLDELESNMENRELLMKLRELVYINEQLKNQELLFKSNCIQQRNQILEEIKSIENLNSNSNENDSDEIKRMKEIEQIYDMDYTKLLKIRQLLALKNQEYSKLNRQLDEYPTRAELIQYERRFVELYELVASKLAETKKYYSLYNSLSESYSYMNSELGLLNSIINNFPIVMKQKNGNSAFLESMEKAVSGVKQQQNQVKSQLDSEGIKKENYMNTQNLLMEKQRAYFKSVKEFQEECNKNEKLLELMESNGISIQEDEK